MDMKKIPGFGLGLIALSLQQVYAAPLSFVDLLVLGQELTETVFRQ